MRSILIGLSLTCLVLGAAISAANDDNAPDTLTIGKAAAVKGGQVAVPIYFFNDQDLAALTIPLSVAGDGARIDSVSFVGGRVAYISTKPVTIDKGRKKVIFGAICMTEDYIAPGQGLMATLYMTIVDSAKADKVTIDTTTIYPASLLFTKSNSSSFIPRTVPGLVTVTATAKKDTKKD